MSLKKTVAKTKYATTILIKSRSPPINSEEIFTSIFFRSIDMAYKANTFFSKITESQGLVDKNWRKIITQLNMDRGSYYHMISKLRGVGLIEKRESFWTKTTHFRKWLEQMLRQVAAIDGLNVSIEYIARE